MRRMKRFTDEEIMRVLNPYNVEATDLGRLCDQIRVYTDLLLRWNRRISLTTITDPLEVLRFHFGESLLAISSVPMRHGRLADVGSGAGFPAIPIRMVCKDVALTLIESNRKKAAFLAEVARELGFSDVQIHPERMEDVDDRNLEFDFVTARAIAIDDIFLRWANNHLKPSGIIALWLGRDDSAKISLSSSWTWRDPINVPGADRRVILVGSKP
jgi:16S rRNA (guanine527-N7)-methyltransferase